MKRLVIRRPNPHDLIGSRVKGGTAEWQTLQKRS